MRSEMSKDTPILAIVMIFSIYIMTLFIQHNSAITGMAVSDAPLAQLGVYNYLTLVENNPLEYKIVLGSLATDYEIILGKKISNFLGAKLISEDYASVDDKMILIGSPNNNLMLNKAMLSAPQDNEAHLLVEGNNLIVIVRDDAQAENMANVILNYRKQTELLSPQSVIVTARSFLIYLIGIILFIVISSIILLEMHRHHGVSRAKESTDEHKLVALEQYIQKYESQGHSEQQIRDWLIKYGYPEQLVNQAINGLKTKTPPPQATAVVKS